MAFVPLAFAGGETREVGNQSGTNQSLELTGFNYQLVSTPTPPTGTRCIMLSASGLGRSCIHLYRQSETIPLGFHMFNVDDLTVRWKINPEVVAGNIRYLFTAFDVDCAPKLSIGLSGSAGLFWAQDGEYMGNFSPQIELDTWSTLQVQVVKGSPGFLKVWVNRNLVFTQFPTFPLQWGYVEIGDFWPQHIIETSWTHYVDDIIAADTSGGELPLTTDFKTFCLLVNAAGSVDQWAGDYGAVDEMPTDKAATSISETVNGETFSAHLQNRADVGISALTNPELVAARVYCVASGYNAATRIKVGFRLAATYAWSDAQFVSGSDWYHLHKLQLTAPSGVAWDINSHLDALEVAVQCAAAGGQVFVSTLAAMVLIGVPDAVVDTTPPAVVDDFRSPSHTTTTISTMWTAVGDDGHEGGAAHHYEMRYKPSSFDWNEGTPVSGTLPTPGAPGTTESFMITGLVANTTYHVKLRVYDEAGNLSQTDAIVVTTGAIVDTTPPRQITDLSAVPIGPTSVRLRWTAPGDDGGIGTANSYDIRWSLSPINEANWGAATQCTGEPAPLVAGSQQSYDVTGLSSGTLVYFAMKAVDDANNWNVLSNVASATTPIVEDTTPPAAISDLAYADVTPATARVSWHAPGDDGAVGTASQYDIRFSTSSITDGNFAAATRVQNAPTPLVAGTLQSCVIGGLRPGTLHYVRMKAVDDAGNWSSLSNQVSFTTPAASAEVNEIWQACDGWTPAATWVAGSTIWFLVYRALPDGATGDSELLTWRLYRSMSGVVTQIWETDPTQDRYRFLYPIGFGVGGGLELACIMSVSRDDDTLTYHRKYILATDFLHADFWQRLFAGTNIRYVSRTPFVGFTFQPRDNTLWFVHYGYNTLWYARSMEVGLASRNAIVPGDRTLGSQIAFSPYTNYSVWGISSGDSIRSQGAAPPAGKGWLWCYGRQLPPRIDLAQFEGMSRFEGLAKIAELVNYAYGWTPDGLMHFKQRLASAPAAEIEDSTHLADARKGWLWEERYGRFECVPSASQFGQPKVTYRAVTVDDNGQPRDGEVFNGDIFVRQTTTAKTRVVLQCVVGNRRKATADYPPVTETWWRAYCPSMSPPWATGPDGKTEIAYDGTWWNPGGWGIWIKLGDPPAPTSDEETRQGFSPGDEIVIDCPGLELVKLEDQIQVTRDPDQAGQHVRTMRIDNPFAGPARALQLCNIRRDGYKSVRRVLELVSELYLAYLPLQGITVSLARLAVSGMVGFVRSVSHSLFGRTPSTDLTIVEWAEPTPAAPQPLGAPLDPFPEPSEADTGSFKEADLIGLGTPPQGPMVSPPGGIQ